MSGPRRARTVDPRIKSPLLYRLSYRPQHLTILMGQRVHDGWCFSIQRIGLTRNFYKSLGFEAIAKPQFFERRQFFSIETYIH